MLTRKEERFTFISYTLFSRATNCPCCFVVLSRTINQQKQNLIKRHTIATWPKSSSVCINSNVISQNCGVNEIIPSYRWVRVAQYLTFYVVSCVPIFISSLFFSFIAIALSVCYQFVHLNIALVFCKSLAVKYFLQIWNGYLEKRFSKFFEVMFLSHFFFLFVIDTFILLQECYISYNIFLYKS